MKRQWYDDYLASCMLLAAYDLRSTPYHTRH